MAFASQISDISFWDSSLSIIASLLAITAAAGGSIAWLYQRRKHQRSLPERKQIAVSAICKSYHETISTWLKRRMTQLQEFSTRSDLRTNKSPHTEALAAVAARLDGFPGGFYTLDENGIVVDHLVPHHPKLNIRGYNASQREYFLDSERLHRPVVSNAIRSADRNTDIVVVAVPRYDDTGRFVGILDGVIDVVSAPFSGVASADASKGFQGDLGGGVLLYLVDEKGTILGTNARGKSLGKSIFEFAPQVRSAADGFVISAGIAETRNIEETPWWVIAIWEDHNRRG